MNKLERHIEYLEITTVIANLEGKLYDAKQLNPYKDFEEQEKILAVLKDYHFSHMELEEENRIMDKKYLSLGNKFDFLRAEYHRQSQELKAIIKENETLKENIQ